MDKVLTAVYETSDYSKFKKLDNNRTVTLARKEKLITSFSAHEIVNPIVVNSEFEIIDGQGRYEAKKELGLPIYYIVDADANIDDCRRMNMYNKPWTVEDFAKSWAESGNENYVNFLRCHEETKCPFSRIMRLVNKMNAENKVITSGRLVFTSADAEMVRNITKSANEIKDALCYQGRTNDAYIVAVKVMVETDGYIHKDMLSNCKNCRSTYNQMAALEDQLKEFTRIYNYHRKSKKLFFEDYMRNRGYNVRNYNQDFSSKTKIDVSTLDKNKA